MRGLPVWLAPSPFDQPKGGWLVPVGGSYSDQYNLGMEYSG
jgi:3-phenylpropionate/trans-cinnamate dioxygenase ferredoxin reductase component